ncbi:Ig-like domain-containing protein [Tenacibaculum sp. 190524A05c]|uniref:Ig-like domain-containing protein n=1 Tax=Tenacibaculum platacis TaxID=3137852 RepID=UPI0032B20A44
MKNWFQILICVFALQSCIQDDIIDDRVDEAFTITNPINEITINDTYQFTTRYTDNVGKTVDINISWTSDDPTIATIDNNGLVTAQSNGQTTIRANVNAPSGPISDSNIISVVAEPVNNNDITTKTGTIITTSSYTLEGTFTIKEIANTNNLELVINDDYNASSSLPGLYLYLTNNTSTINNAKEVGAVPVFSGSHTYIIENTGINDFTHLLYWCKPFSVKVGEAEIE